MVSRRWTSAILAAVVAGAGTVGVVTVSSGSDESEAKRATDFEPRSLKGKWTGAWENLTFGSEGDILANVKFRDGKFIPLVNFSGDVLGCPNPPSDKITLKEGNGKDKWNDDGFKVVEDTDAFGDLKLTYKRDEGNEVTASGNSPCDPNTTFELTGKLTRSKFTGDVEIDFGDGSGATSKLSANED